MKMKKIHKQILETLRENSPLTLAEISENLGMPNKTVYKAIRKLFEEGLIETEKVKYYKLSEEAETKDWSSTQGHSSKNNELNEKGLFRS